MAGQERKRGERERKREVIKREWLRVEKKIGRKM